MKKLILFAALFLLVGCSSEHAVIEEDVSLQLSLKEVPTVIEEKTHYYIHDELMPVYVMLKDYPSDSLIDWNKKTGLNNNNWLSFELTQEEAVRGVEIYTEDLETIDLKINGLSYVYKVTDGHQIIEFKESIMTSKVELRTLGSGKIYECHITGDRMVDEATYQLYKAMEEDLKTLETFEWSGQVEEDFHTMDKVKEIYDIYDLESLSKDFDYNRLRFKEGGLGCPFRVSGKIIQAKEKNGYYELTIDTLLDKEKVIVYTLDERALNEMFSETCILTEKNETLKLITIQ